MSTIHCEESVRSIGEHLESCWEVQHVQKMPERHRDMVGESCLILLSSPASHCTDAEFRRAWWRAKRDACRRTEEPLIPLENCDSVDVAERLAPLEPQYVPGMTAAERLTIIRDARQEYQERRIRRFQGMVDSIPAMPEQREHDARDFRRSDFVHPVRVALMNNVSVIPCSPVSHPKTCIEQRGVIELNCVTARQVSLAMEDECFPTVRALCLAGV